MLFSLVASQARAQTSVSGTIVSDTRWTLAGSPYRVLGEVSVQNGATLSIDPGVVVYMDRDAGVTVQSGGIKALGTAANPIQVRSDNSRVGAPAAPGDWNQWVFGPGTVNTRLEHVLFEHGKGLVVNGSAPVFNYLDLRNHEGAAITVDLAASPSGLGNQASGNTLNGVAVPAGDITGSVNWGLRGIPYVVSSGVVSVGASPTVSAITPNRIQQGDTATVSLSGSRLTGASLARFDASGLSAQVLPGGTNTHVDLSVSAAATVAVSASALTLLVDAGEIRVANAITVERARPTITGFDPASVHVGQPATSVTINGRNFTADSVALVNGFAVTTQFVSATQLLATVPSQASSSDLSVRVRAPDSLNPGQFLISDEAVLPAIVVPTLRVRTYLGTTNTVVGKGLRSSGIELAVTRFRDGATFAGEEITVNLSCANSAICRIPTSPIKIPLGAIYTYFSIEGLEVGTTTITATAEGYTASLDFGVTVSPPTLSFNGPSNSVASGAQAPFTVGLTAPGAIFPSNQIALSPVMVSLASNSPSVGSVPSMVTIQAGDSTSATVNFTALAGGTTTLTASGTGLTSATTAPITVILPEFRIGTYLGAASTVVGKGLRSAGNELAISRVINGVPFGAGQVTVNLTCASSTICSVPPTVTIPAGAQYVYFGLDGLDIGQTTITATAPGYNGSSSFTVNVIAPQLNFNGLAGTTTVGAQSAFSVYLTSPGATFINQTAVNPITVNLSSSSPDVASVPSSVTIPAGSNASASVSLSGLTVGATTLTASGTGLASATTGVAVVANVCTPPPSGLVGWWTADGTADDRVGTNNGTLQNGASFAAGKVGQAFSFDGIDDYVNLGNSPAYSLSDFTLQAWVSTDPANNTGERRIVGFDDVGYPAPQGRQFYTLKSSSPYTCGADGRLALQIQSPGGYGQVCAPTPLTAGFHHVAGVRSGTTLMLYIDGALVATQTGQPAGVITPTAPVVIGQVSPSYNGEFFKGLIDEIAIHNRALSTSEISTVFQAGSRGMCKQCQPAPTGTTGWWPADGSMNDIAGTNHGTPTSGVTFTAGKVGQAAVFDGVGGTVNFGNSAGNFGAGDFSVHFWMKTGSTRYESIIGKRPVCSFATFWDVRMNAAGRLSLELDGGDSYSYSYVVSSRSVNDSVFHHVAMVRQGATLSMYIDGVLDASASTAFANVDSSADLIAGRSKCTLEDNTFFFTGVLDELATMNRALSAAEIQAIVAASSAGMCHAQCAAPANAVSWWAGEGNTNDAADSNIAVWEGPAAYAPGVKGQAFKLNGASRLRVPNAPNLRISKNDFSIEAWVRFDALSGDMSIIDTIANGTNADGWRLLKQADSRFWFCFGGGTNRCADPAYTLFSTTHAQTGVFYHVVVVKTASQFALYVNGTREDVHNAVPDFVDTQNAPLYLGGNAVEGAYLVGLIDEVKIYSRALKASEIGPVSWWKGDRDQDASDSLNVNPGSLQGGVTITPAKVGRGFSFDGTSGYVQANYNPSFDPGLSSFSLDAWVKTSRATGTQVVVSRYECGQVCLSGVSASAYVIYMTDGVLQAWARDSDSGDRLTIQGTRFIADNAFHHVALVRDMDSGMLRLYLDGAVEASALLEPLASGTIKDDDNDPDPFVIGAIVQPGGFGKEQFFAGVIDEVRYWKVALTSPEVNAIFRADKVGVCLP